MTNVLMKSKILTVQSVLTKIHRERNLFKNICPRQSAQKMTRIVQLHCPIRVG